LASVGRLHVRDQPTLKIQLLEFDAHMKRGVEMTARGLRRRFITGTVAILGAGLIASPCAVPLAAKTTQPVELTVIARLTTGMVAERTTLHIQGTTVSALAVDRRHPVTTLNLKLPQPGRYAYTLSSTAVYEFHGERHLLVGAGGGAVEAQAGRSFAVSGDPRHRVPSTVLESR
jgi:hypothetical protein